MHDAPAWIRKRATASFNPAQVEATLVELSERWPSENPSLVDLASRFPLGESALIHLLALSSVSAARLVQHPEILLWLSRPEICANPRNGSEMAAELHSVAGDSVAEDNFRGLRLWKNREMTRIALREVADVAPLEETTAELSQIAEICVRRVFQYWNDSLRERHGSPDAEFTVLALGKLGGSELNHSSDVDLIFLYSEEGKLAAHFSYHEFFNRLAAKILETFNSTHPEGPLFRVDLRLRPEGTAGPLTRSLRSMEYYYSGFGETWERLALIKARGIAGSAELTYDFLRQHQPFIYPKSATPDLLEQIANIKQRIEHDVVGSANLHRDVKLGRGGIREIEFVVQTIQFIHGARHAFLQGTSTLKALRALAELELIPQNEIVDLDRAYRFLRRTEHRLQIEAEQQTHTLPTEPKHLERLALSLGFASADAFNAELEGQTEAVRKIFDRVVSAAPPSRTREALTIFSNEAQAQRALVELEHGPRNTHVSARTRQISRKLRPLLFEQLAESADPDATLTQFVRFADAYGMRSMLFELLVANPRLLELLTKTFDASRFAGDLLVRHPALLEEVTRGGKLDQSVDTAGHLSELRASVKKNDVDFVREYRQSQLLRILLRDVLQLTDLAHICSEQTALAEACLIVLNEIIGAKNLTIIALGKFGGRELSYGADLDVVFVGEDSSAAQRIIAASAQASSEGSLPRIDARLRPDGEKGPLVCSLESYRQYYETRAQFWELQALTRARPIVGPMQNEFIALAKHLWKRAGEDVDLMTKIDDMLERIRRERGSGSEFRDFKTGTGGIIEAEFLIQALQMRANVWEPTWSRAVSALERAGHLSKKDVVDLRVAYELLRRCESVLRRYENATVSSVPADAAQRQMLARRLGFATPEVFAERYRAARLSIHGIYSRVFKKAPLMSREQVEKLLND
ncbi:MAG: bifunctional [glutamate--ammonia ligase]-adenylyl-L-tyrosine phosphorylase/[glutamate--ammonia-ligase] adenylyltransferase [Spartobacteria bacterium]